MAAINIKTNGTAVLQLYDYDPSASAAYAFIAIFGIATVVHFVMMIPWKAAYFIPFIIGGVMEAGGYYGRAWSHSVPLNLKPYILQYLLILIAPVFFAASIYMSLSRLIVALNATSRSAISPRWLTTLFVLGDVLCFLMQMSGGGLQATGQISLMDTGAHIVLAGLALQIVISLGFIATIAGFHVRLRRRPTMLAAHPALTKKWPRFIVALYVAVGCILLRNFVRVIEYAQGTDGYVQSHEAMAYVFDAALMAGMMYVLLFWHPGRLIRATRRVGLGMAAHMSADGGNDEGAGEQYDGQAQHERALKSEVSIGVVE